MKRLTLILGILGAALSACGPSESTETSYKEDRYDPATCAFTADQGGSVNGEAPKPRLELTYFQKKIDLSYLDQVAELSASQTVEFLNKQGLKIFKAPRKSSKNCSTFANLPDAPRDLLIYWKSLLPPDPKAELALAGVFVESHQKDIPSSKDSPVIVLREDATRWTLLHESLHFQFYKARKANAGEGFSESQKALQVAKLAFDTAMVEAKAETTTTTTTTKKKQIRTLAEAAENYVNASILFLKNFDLEEIAIEALLVKAHSEGRLGFVPDLRANARAYTQAKAVSSEKKINYLKESVKLSLELARPVDDEKSEELLNGARYQVDQLELQFKQAMMDLLR